jgi:DNA-binding response OmpR family regulator
VVVEDEPTQRKQIIDHLTRLGLDVVAVGDGIAALECIRERRPFLVCIDLSLPHICGYEVCERIRAEPELEDVAIIITSGRASLEERAHSYEAGADAYLSKPHSFDKVAKEVERLIARDTAHQTSDT